MKESWQVFLNEFSQKINNGKTADTQTALQWLINVNPYRKTTRLQPFWEYMSQTDLEQFPVIKPKMYTSHQNWFIQEGELWTMKFNGKEIQLPNLKGFQDIYRLLSQPHQPIHCTYLIGAQIIEKGEEIFDEKAK